MLGSVIASVGGFTNFPLWFDIPLPPGGNFLVALYPISFGYAIIRFRFLGIRVILTQLFVFVLGFILLVQTFLAPALSGKIIGFSIFLLFSFFGYLLIRSVIKEIKRREEVEALSKRLAKALRDIQAKNIHLQKLLKMRSEFLDIASHQLYTPLTAIRGYLSSTLLLLTSLSLMLQTK